MPNTPLTTLNKRATPRNAFLALLLFALNALLLGQLDQPLEQLAGGEPKLDLRFGYDLATVHMLFDAYGPEGRAIYVWNLLVDTPFPVLAAATAILFVLLAFKQRRWQKLLSVAPLVFMITDLCENALLFTLVQSHPALSPGLVAVTSLITQVKRAAFYLSAVTLLASLLLLAYRGLRRALNPASPG